MTSDINALHNEIAALTLRVARPLIWHDRTERWPKEVNGATCFFLRFGQGVIGVTADHVIAAYENAVAINTNTVCQLRNSPIFELTEAIIARDPERDIATFGVSEELVSSIEAIPLDCRGAWPPPEPQNGWPLSVCGFPASTRTTRSDGSAEFRAWGALPVVEGVTPHEILITYDPAIVRPTAFAPELPPVGFNLSGCSGGPVLVHGSRNGLHRWFPVGLISWGPKDHEKQGLAAEFDLIRLRRIDMVQPDGTFLTPVEEIGWLPR